MKTIEIDTEFITLGQFLKLSDCISTGGQARFFIQENVITVNDQPEDRRGRKLYPLDFVEVAGIGRFQVVKS